MPAPNSTAKIITAKKLVPRTEVAVRVYQQQTTGVTGGRVIGSFDSHAEDQCALDTLADREFPVARKCHVG